MKKTSNQDMLNAIRDQASAEYQDRVPFVDGRDIQPRAVLKTFEGYPTIKNEFLNTLINKVVKTDFFSRVYSNPLKELKKGMLPYGATIEELFMLAAEPKGFFSDDSSGYNDGLTITDSNLKMEDKATALLGTEKAKLKKLYITLNFAHVFKTSISDSQLAHAFTSANGLSELVNQITSSLTNGAEQREYKDMIELLKASAQQKQLLTDGKGLILPLDTPSTYDSNKGDIPKALTSQNDISTEKMKNTKNGVLQAMYKYDIEGTVHWTNPDEEGKALSKAIRTLTGRMKFVNTKYNMAGVPTFCNPEDLVFICEPETVAMMDVDVLASAFNVSMADIKTRIILVDELPKKWFTGLKMKSGMDGDGVGYYYKETSQHSQIKPINGVAQKCYGILMDKNFIQAIDTVNEARQFENGRALMTNLFLHRQGMLSNCYFSNCVALFNHAGYEEVKPQTTQA